MPNHFGIDASNTAQNVLPIVTARLRKPEWIGRYLCQIPGVSTGLTVEEVTYIHAQGLGLLLIYNGLTIDNVRGDYAAGLYHGGQAAILARALGAPSNAAIAFDWETNMSPNVMFARGVHDGAGPHAHVVYLNPFTSAHAAAYSGMRTATTGPCYYWSSEPEYNAWFDTVRTDFTPALIAGSESQAVFHQYSENNLGRAVDLDVCNDAGFALLWGPQPVTPPAPTSYEVTSPGSLKSQPNHTSSAAIDPHGNPVFLELGAVVIPTGPVQVTNGEAWLPVKLPAPSPVHGFFARKGLGPDTDV